MRSAELERNEATPVAERGGQAASSRSVALAVVRDLFLWMLAVGLTMLFRGNNAVMAGGILAVFAARELAWHSRGDVRIFVLGLVFGCSIEIAGTAIGVWTYTDPSFLGIPLWLPAAWGITAVVLRHVGQAIGGAGRS